MAYFGKMSSDRFGLLRQVLSQGEKSTLLRYSTDTEQVYLDPNIGIKLHLKLFVTGLCLLSALLQQIFNKFIKRRYYTSHKNYQKIVDLNNGANWLEYAFCFILVVSIYRGASEFKHSLNSQLQTENKLRNSNKTTSFGLKQNNIQPTNLEKLCVSFLKIFPFVCRATPIILQFFSFLK